MLSHRCRVCPVCMCVCPACPVLTLTLVYCGQTVGLIKVKLGTYVGLGPGHIVLDGDPAPQKRGPAAPNLATHCGQTARWIKVPLGTR